jgi:prepilin-type N-terminal cleavage/methylation domain-containing protein
MFKKQHGYTLTEIMIAVGVVAAMTIGGLNFYNNSVAKAQANQAYVFGKLIVDDALDHFAAYGQLPTMGDNYGGNYAELHNVDYAMFVESVTWVDAGGQESGYALVTLSNDHIHQTLIDAQIAFYVDISTNGSHVFYTGCKTKLVAGKFDNVAVVADNATVNPGQSNFKSPLIPECDVVSSF